MKAAEVRYEEVAVEEADVVLVAYGTSARIAKGLVARRHPPKASSGSCGR